MRELEDGTYGLVHLADFNEVMAMEAEYQRRAERAAAKESKG